MTDKTFTLDELCTLAGLPRRTVRYYVQIGLVDRPVGETRAARYAGEHLAQLLRVRALSQAGVSLERIREVLAGAQPPVPVRPRAPGATEVRSHVHLAPGVELQVSPEEAGLSPDQLRRLVAAVVRELHVIQEQDRD